MSLLKVVRLRDSDISLWFSGQSAASGLGNSYSSGTELDGGWEKRRVAFFGYQLLPAVRFVHLKD